ncbi:hypothetical protein [Commensalibacter communis]|uniref:hypothetical protein n=1 Tax=Commensalibacter communis TaxID=2972786 RepID=UPI0035211414
MERYTNAANNGNLKAQYNLGITYLEDDDIPQDYKKAKKWWKKRLNKETIKRNLI